MKHNRKLREQIEGSEMFGGEIDNTSQMPKVYSVLRHRNGIVAFMADFVASHRSEDVAQGTRDFLASAKSLFGKDKSR
jgi:hypothetical protein